MITEATIRAVKYPPELIPDSWFGNLALNAEFAPPILDLRRFSPNILRLVNIQTPAAANANLRLRYDEVRLEQNTLAMLAALVGAWDLPAKDQLYLNFFGLGALAHTTHYGVWAYPPTIAHKIQWGIALNEKEKAINQELGIADTVEKGLLPLPISQLIEREYPIVGEETHTRNVNIAVPATIYPIEVMYAKPGEVLVLTRIAAVAGAAVNNVQIIVDRDNDANYLTFPTWPLNILAGGEIACFIPAFTQLRLTTTSTVAPGAGMLFRYTVARVKLTNILRVRFGLLTEAEAPADLYKKVMGGIV
jgi:hypothetical protein